MAQPKGHHLYVNLPASEVRRRLEGFGHGVRKIQSGGRRQAVVIHTATGKHLAELEAKFSDTRCSSRPTDLGEPIQNLRNIGPTSGAWLHEVGIGTIADLERIGPVMAFETVRGSRPGVSINLLWALAAGLKAKDAQDLSQAQKQQLRQQWAALTES